MPLKRVPTLKDIKSGIKQLDNSKNTYSIDLSGEVLPDLDRSKSKEVLKFVNFDNVTFSRTSKNHLPQNFDPNLIFEKGKSIGLGIEEVHKMGYTGEGVGVAIIDSALSKHDDINIKEKLSDGIYNKGGFHGAAVYSVLSGKQTGIAPKSDLYYFEEKYDNHQDGGIELNEALVKVIEKNNTLPDDKKIRVISYSAEMPHTNKTKELVTQLEKSGVWVLDGYNFIQDFGILEKKNPMGDNNDFNNYCYYSGKLDNLFVNSGDRTVISPFDENSYRHDPEPCTSRSIPAVAGYYVLACQADSTMTPNKFKKLARETAKTISTEIDKTRALQTDEQIPSSNVNIKVIDIKALIQKIQMDKMS